jgi:hypothetical protein
MFPDQFPSTTTYLNVGQCAMTNCGLAEVLDPVCESRTLQYFRTSPIGPKSKLCGEKVLHQLEVSVHKLRIASVLLRLKLNVRSAYGLGVSYDEIIETHKRCLVSDKTDVRRIDSVYRNRDAGIARRGLKKLDKWWGVNDETLEKVVSAVGPVCTLRKKQAPIVGNDELDKLMSQLVPSGL